MRLLPPTSAGLAEACEILARGGVVIHATETCYGIACDLQNPEAVRRLFTIKDRPFDQPVSALCESLEQAQECTDWNEKALELGQEHLPGPLTVILPVTPENTLSVTPDNQATSIGIRISSLPLAQDLVAQFGSPLSTTSANVHSEPSPYSVTEIMRQYEGREQQPDAIIDSGEIPEVSTSTIVRVVGEEAEVLRGALS